MNRKALLILVVFFAVLVIGLVLPNVLPSALLVMWGNKVLVLSLLLVLGLSFGGKGTLRWFGWIAFGILAVMIVGKWWTEPVFRRDISSTTWGWLVVWLVAFSIGFVIGRYHRRFER